MTSGRHPPHASNPASSSSSSLAHEKPGQQVQMDGSVEPSTAPSLISAEGRHTDELIYRIILEQSPIRGRATTYGDKDRRPLSPAVIVRLQIFDTNTMMMLDSSQFDTSFLTLQAELVNAGTHTSAVLLRLDPDETDEEQTQVASTRAQRPLSPRRPPPDGGADINSYALNSVSDEPEPFLSAVPTTEVSRVPENPLTTRNEGHMDLMQYARMPIPTLPPRAEVMGRRYNKQGPMTMDLSGYHLVDGHAPSIPSSSAQLDGPSHLGHHLLDGLAQQPTLHPPTTGPSSYGGLPNRPPSSNQVDSSYAHLAGTSNPTPGPSDRPVYPSRASARPPGPSAPSAEVLKRSQPSRLKEKEPVRTKQQRSVRVLRNFLGTPVSAAFLCRDLQDAFAIFFVLSDLSVREEGTYQLRLSLSALNHHGQASERVTPIVTSLYTPEFSCFVPRRFPGQIPATELARKLSSQGVRIPVRAEPRATNSGKARAEELVKGNLE